MNLRLSQAELPGRFMDHREDMAPTMADQMAWELAKDMGHFIDDDAAARADAMGISLDEVRRL